MSNEQAYLVAQMDDIPTAEYTAAPPREPVFAYGLELQQKCSFGCEHCYMYLGVNAALRVEGKAMPLEVVELTAQRIAEHVSEFSLPKVFIVLHGGEPMLNKKHLLDSIAIIRETLGETADIRIQTNGLHLTEEFAAELARPDVNTKVGISIDGTPEDHDRSRPLIQRHPDEKPRGSYKFVADNAFMLRDKFPLSFEKVIFTLNKHTMHGASSDFAGQWETNASETFDSLMQFRPPANPGWQLHVNPEHGNWDHPSAIWDPTGETNLMYTWLKEFFDRWWDTGGAQLVEIPLFDTIIQGRARQLGRRAHQSDFEFFGLGNAAILFVERDGSYRGTDGHKVSGPHADEVNMNIREHSISDTLNHPLIVQRQLGMAALSPICQKCDLVKICGGGRFGDRRRNGDYRNPALYCTTWKPLIRHIIERTQPIFEMGT